MVKSALEQEAENLVRSARSGDQNAMAMLQAVGESDSQQSQLAYEAIQKYIIENPFGDEASPMTKEFHPEAGTEFLFRCVVLARGPLLDNQRINAMAATFRGQARELFEFGVSNFDKQVKEHPQIQLGQCVGRARSMQALGIPSVPISIFSPGVAWELGE